MKNKHIAFGIVGVLVGFVLGFFASQAISRQPPLQVAAASADEQLPEGHPPMELISRLQELEVHSKEHPEDPVIRIQLGNAYYDMKLFDRAVPWYEEALQLDPKNINVINDLGTSYFALGEAQKAIEILENSLELSPDNPIALQNLGWIYFNTGDYQASIETWERLVAVHPDHENVEQVKKHLEDARAHLSGEHSQG